MTTEKKGFKVIYDLIQQKKITYREAYNLTEAVFAQTFVPTPFPVTDDTPQYVFDGTQTEEPQTNEITVRGFTNGYYD